MKIIEEVKFKFFTWDEIFEPIKKQGITKEQIPADLLSNIVPTMVVLDELREYYGEKILINSTYRTKKYNQQVGGKPNSLHLSFNAVDFTVNDKKDLPLLYRRLELWDTVDNMFISLPKPKGNFGLGLYSTFIHLDTRSILNKPSPARWRG